MPERDKPQLLGGAELGQASGGYFWMPEAGRRGTDGTDVMEGGERGDQLRGMGGQDSLMGHEGDDTLHGGDGDDHLSGGSGNDWLTGGAGRDELLGGFGADVLDGNEGDDRIIVIADGEADNVDGGEGSDTLRIHAPGIHVGNIGISITSGDPAAAVRNPDGSIGVAGLSGTISFANPDGSQATITFRNIERITFS